MELYFLDKNFQLASMPVEDFASLTWAESWTEPGRFTLYVDFKYFPIISKSRYIYNTDAQKAAVIETIQYTQADGERVVLTGRTLESLLERRVAERGYVSSASAKVEESAYAVFNRYASPSGVRSLEGMTAGDHIQGFAETGEVTVMQGDNLAEWMYSTLPLYGMSPLVVADMDFGAMYLTCKHLVDRTIDNKDKNSPIMLSHSFENTRDDAYSYDETELINHVYVIMPSDPCYGKQIVEVDKKQEEEPRVEIYIESSASSEPTEKDGVLTPTVSLAECKAIMKQEGLEAMEGHAIQESVSCAIEQTAIYQYRRDFWVGDKVSYTSGIIGVSMDAQITEVEEIYEAGGKKVNIRIGRDFSSVNYLRKMVQKIKGGRAL